MLIDRGYDKELLGREFTKVVETYRQEFEKWEIPTNIKIWFDNIINPQINDITTGSDIPNRIPSFSQPLPITTPIRHNYHRQ